MKNDYALSHTMITKYYSSLLYILEEMSETLTGQEVKLSLDSQGSFSQEVTTALSKIVNDHSAKGHALASIKKKALTSTLINFEYKFCLTAADSHIVKKSDWSAVAIRMTLLNNEGKKEEVFMELSLHQFYEMFRELKKASTLINMLA